MLLRVGLVKSQLVGQLTPALRHRLRASLSYENLGHIIQRRKWYRRTGKHNYPGHLKWDGVTRLFSDTQKFPAGLTDRVIEICRANGVEPMVVNDFKIAEPTPLTLPIPIQLWDHQRDAIDEIKKHRHGVIRIGTGGGKSRLSIVATAEIGQLPVLFVVNRVSLLTQAHQDYEKLLGIKVGFIGDGQMTFGKVNIATVHTLCSILKIEHEVDDEDKKENVNYTEEQINMLLLMLKATRMVIVDECFPAGTLIDGKPIEEYRIGDFVTAYDPRTGEYNKKKVTRVFAKPYYGNVFSINGEITSTKEHPFYTLRGWRKASELTIGDYVLKYGNRNDLRPMSSNVLLDRQKENMAVKTKTSCVLHDDLHEKVREPSIQSNHVKNEFKVCFSANADQESNAESCYSNQNGKHTQISKSQTCSKRWKWQRFISLRRDASSQGSNIISANSKNESKTWFRVSLSLQDRPWPSISNACYRNRWRKSLRFISASPRSKEERFAYFSRVDSITVQEHGNSRESGYLRRDSLVYNLEVEDYHTYVADNFVVHNCHHSASDMYVKLLDQLPNATYRIGLSATPFRTDGLDIMIEAAFGKTLYTKPASDLILDGVLAKPYITFVDYDDPLTLEYPYQSRKDVEESFKSGKKKTKKAQYNTVYKNCVVENDTFNRLVAKIALASAKMKRLTLVSVKQVAHGNALIDAIKSIDPHAKVTFLHGGNKKELNEEKVKSEFASHKIEILISTLFDEGVDIPAIDVVIDGGGGKSPIKTLQLVGRAMRKYPGKEKAYIYMFIQRYTYLYNHSEERLDILLTEPEFVIDSLKI